MWCGITRMIKSRSARIIIIIIRKQAIIFNLYIEAIAMLKSGIQAPSYEKSKHWNFNKLTSSDFLFGILIAFIRDALFNSGTRLDGRGVHDWRSIDFNITRSESCCTSEVKLGKTIVVTEVSGTIVPPFPDKPDEGFLHFNTDVLTLYEHTNAFVSYNEISRALERIIRDSKCLDTSSLCIVSGEKVWQISCLVRIIDAAGGNVLDTAILSAMGALRGFRKPDISVIQTELVDEIEREVESTTTNTNRGGRNKGDRGGGGKVKTQSSIVIHHSDDREPLPLALFHTPLSISMAIFFNKQQQQVKL
jgi:hypothetical protein